MKKLRTTFRINQETYDRLFDKKDELTDKILDGKLNIDGERKRYTITVGEIIDQLVLKFIDNDLF